MSLWTGFSIRLKVFSKEELVSHIPSSPLQCLPLKPEDPGTNGLMAVSWLWDSRRGHPQGFGRMGSLGR